MEATQPGKKTSNRAKNDINEIETCNTKEILKNRHKKSYYQSTKDYAT